LAGGRFDAVPEGRFGREQVAGAADGFDGGHGFNSVSEMSIPS